jgi:hypothetical protein
LKPMSVSFREIIDGMCQEHKEGHGGYREDDFSHRP